jgi:hypothetical protein
MIVPCRDHQAHPYHAMQRLSMYCVVPSSPDTMSRVDMPLVSNEGTPTAFTGPLTPQGLSSANIPSREHGGIQLLRRTLMQGAVAVIDFDSAIQTDLECNAADPHYLDWTDEDFRNAVEYR